MKSPIFSILLFGVLSSHAYSQYTYSQIMTFSLTETSTLPALPAKDNMGRAIRGESPVSSNEFTITTSRSRTSTQEFSTKLGSLRISNKEILEQLVDENVIGTIVGYSIVQVFEDNTNSQDSDTFKVYLTKKNESPRDISNFIRFISQRNAMVLVANLRTTDTTTIATNVTTQTKTATLSARELYTLELQFNFGAFTTSGINAWTNTLRTFGTGVGQYSSYVPTTGRISGMVGYGYFGENEDRTLFEGGITLSGGVPITLPSIGL